EVVVRARRPLGEGVDPALLARGRRVAGREEHDVVPSGVELLGELVTEELRATVAGGRDADERGGDEGDAHAGSTVVVSYRRRATSRLLSLQIDVEVLDGREQVVARGDQVAELGEAAQRVGRVDRVSCDHGEDVAVLDDDRGRSASREVAHEDLP